MSWRGTWRQGVVFFFSSRRRHTRCYRDWSSDVCSSDLGSDDEARDHVANELREHGGRLEIGRASGRERGEISGVAGSLKKKKTEHAVTATGVKRRNSREACPRADGML